MREENIPSPLAGEGEGESGEGEPGEGESGEGANIPSPLAGEGQGEGESESHPEVLRGINLTIEPGQRVAVLGAPGSGKSAMVSLIPRFYDVTSGRITLDNVDVRDLNLRSLRRNVAIVPQDVFLFAATIRENIAYGVPNAPLEDVIEAARSAQIHDFIDSLPDKYETLVGERGITLSGGQRQRVALARTLLMDPSCPAAGRLHLQRRRGHGGPDTTGPGRGDEGPDHHRNHPQDKRRQKSRPGPCHGGRPGSWRGAHTRS